MGLIPQLKSTRDRVAREIRFRFPLNAGFR